MLIIERFLICDGGCGTNFGVDMRGRNTEQQRSAARIEGWVFIKGKDYCPDCKPMKLMSPREKENIFNRKL